MLIKVQVYHQGEEYGTITWDGERFILSPPDDVLLNNMVYHHPLPLFLGDKFYSVSSKGDPVLFITNLYMEYRSIQTVSVSEPEYILGPGETWGDEELDAMTEDESMV